MLNTTKEVYCSEVGAESRVVEVVVGRGEEGCTFQREQPVQRYRGLKEHNGLRYM